MHDLNVDYQYCQDKLSKSNYSEISVVFFQKLHYLQDILVGILSHILNPPNYLSKKNSLDIMKL